MRAWLVPDTLPVETVERAVFLPDDPLLIAAFKGAFLLLCDPDNWESLGEATPDECAALWQELFSEFIGG